MFFRLTAVCVCVAALVVLGSPAIVGAEEPVAATAGAAGAAGAAPPAELTFQASLPHTHVPLASGPIVVDGAVDAAEWSGAADVFGFLLLGSGNPATADTRVLLLIDDTSLYVAFICAEPAMDALVGRYTGRDEQTWTDDSVEVYIAPRAHKSEYRQTIVSAAGGTFDGHGMDPSWNGEWESAVGRGEGEWYCEVALSRESFGIAGHKAGDVFGLSLTRNRMPVRELSSWPPLVGTFHAPLRFGTAHIGEPLEMSVGLSGMSLRAGEAPEDAGEVTCRLRWDGGSGKASESTVPLTDPVPFSAPEVAPAAGADESAAPTILRLTAELRGGQPLRLLGYARYLFRSAEAAEAPQN